MKAAVIRTTGGRKRIDVEDVPIPAPGPGEALVQVEAAGICGSDLHGFLDHDGTARSEGLIMGHEAGGSVTAVGSGVDTLRAGDRVTVDPQIYCGQCGECRRGLISICANKQVMGSSLRGFHHGALAEYLVAPAERIYALPDTVTTTQGALVEPLANALHVVNRQHFAVGDTIVVLGSGTLGLLITQCARIAGAGTVIVTDTDAERLQLAASFGADITVDVSADDLAHTVNDLTQGRGADLVVEAVGISATYQQAVDIVKRRGAVAFFGATQADIQLPLYPVLHKELTLVGCTGANDETTTAIDLVANGRVALSDIVTRQFSLDDAQSAFDFAAEPANHSVKTQLIP